MNKDELLSKIFHDIKGPLTSISGYIQLLEMDLADNNVMIEYMPELSKSCKDMLEILNSSRQEIEQKFKLI